MNVLGIFVISVIVGTLAAGLYVVAQIIIDYFNGK